MKIPVIGGHSKRRSTNQDAQRTVNLMLEIDAAEPETGAAMYLVPGKSEFATIGEGPVRGMIRFGDWVIAVSDTKVYRVGSDGASKLIGSIALNHEKTVAMSANRDVVIICSGEYAYVSDGLTLTQVTDSDYPGSNVVDYLNGYFIFAIPDSQQFFISGLNSGVTYDALDFAQAESNVDNIIGLIVDHQELWLFGEYSTEIWYDSGSSDFPLARRDGAVMECGCAARGSIAKADNTIFWLGQNQHGRGIVYRADQYNPQIVSNRGIEYAISRISDISDAIAYTYQQSGHTFYVLTFPSGGLTCVYDASISEPELAWHVRETYSIGRDRGNCYAFAWGAHLVGDYASNVIWQMRDDVYTDGGLPIVWERTIRRITGDGKRVFFHDLTINLERGVGLTSGQGSNPVMYLDWSDDGGHTWSNKREGSMGAMGVYRPVVTFTRLGCSRDRVFRLSGSDPVKTVIIGGYLSATTGDH